MQCIRIAHAAKGSARTPLGPIKQTVAKIPHMERIRLSKIEQRMKRMEMKEMKSNLWKWRGGQTVGLCGCKLGKFTIMSQPITLI